MNRRSFLKKLGALVGLALVAPKALLAEPAELFVADTLNYPELTQQAMGNLTKLYSGTKVRFNNTDFGVITINSNKTAAKLWSKHLHREMKINSRFDALMGKQCLILY